MHKIRKLLLAGTALPFLLGHVNPTFAADPVAEQRFTPAPSFMVGGSACISGNPDFSLFGSVATAAGVGFGAQADGMVSVDEDGDLSGLVAGHLFHRDPSRGLVGAYAAYRGDGSGGRKDGFRLGVEGEAYLDRLTLSGLVGWDFANEEVFGQAKLSAYFAENTRLYVGYAREDRDFGIVGVEHMFTPTASAFAEGWFSDDGDAAARIGVKLHFGGSAPSADEPYEPFAIASNEAVDVPPPQERTLRHRDRAEIIPLWMQVCDPGDSSNVSNPEPTTTVMVTQTTVET